ncbi:MAG: PQQ-binding-like beta-propeller repeat protein, partial [Pirellulales bacterium]|nr:PQQ-binding-like beta-propeller repeat protein [Pirellulales bacterium]
ESLASSSNAARESSARSVASLSYFVTCFSDHPAANTARLRLAEVIRNVDPANLDVELLLRRVLRSGDEQQRTEALVGITDWYLDNDNAVMAQVTGELLLKQDSVPGQSPSTGYAASFRDEITGVLRRLTAATKQDEIHDGWGAWDKQSPQQANTINVGHLRPLSDGGSLAPSDFDSKTGQMFLDVQNAGSLVQLDAMGRTAWTLPVDRAMGVRRYLAPTAYRFQTLGQLRLVSMGDRLLSIGSTGQSAAVLGEDVFSATILGASPRDVHMRSLLHGWGEDRYYLTDTRGRALGEMALLSEDCLCILQGEDVVARHPILKGKAYWSRRVSGSAERLFGSQDHLFVTVGEQATIYSTADGRVLGERDVPPDNEIMTTLGDAVVRWTNLENGRVRIALVDCWKGSLDDPAVIWQHEFATGTKARLVSSRQLAVLERSGRFRVLDMATGDAKLESQLRPDEELNRIFVMVHGDMLVLIANTNEAFKQDRAVSVPLPAAPGSVRVNGWIYGINLNKGEKTWEKRVGEHGIWLGQPSGLPVLTLACVANLRKQGQQLRATSVLIIDKRNGAVIHEDDAVMSAASSYQISGDPDTRTVTLDLAGSSSLLFHFQEPIHQPIKSPEN